MATTWGEYLRKAADFLDSDRVLTVKEIVVDTWDDLVIEVRNSYRDIKDVVRNETGVDGKTPGPTVHDEHVEFVEAFPPPKVEKVPTYDEKIDYIRKWYKENGQTQSAWLRDPVPYGHTTIDSVYNKIVRLRADKELRERQALQRLRTHTEGDRFGRIDGPFNPRDYWRK